MPPAEFEITVGSANTTALYYVGYVGYSGRGAEPRLPTANCPRITWVLGHGAGGRQRHPSMTRLAEALSARRHDVFTFDFLYTHAGRRLPDKNDVLEATWRAVLGAVRSRIDDGAERRLFIGGRSMGGRIATQVAAGNRAGPLAGLVLFGYPLHPPGRPDKPRSAHLPQIKVPMLFVQGSRDAFGRPDELEPLMRSLGPGSRVYIVEGGDHSFNVPKSHGESPDTIVARIADEVVAFAEQEAPAPKTSTER